MGQQLIMGLKEQQTESTFESFFCINKYYRHLSKLTKRKKFLSKKLEKKALKISNLNEIQRISSENSVNLC